MKIFNDGLVVADFASMPYAFWTLGPGSWPNHGKIDIVEGVNTRQTLVNFTFFSFCCQVCCSFMPEVKNQFTFHTGASRSCTIPNQAPIVDGDPAFTANVLNTNCSSSPKTDTGSGFSDTCALYENFSCRAIPMRM
jgi:hypothetical protein